MPSNLTELLVTCAVVLAMSAAWVTGSKLAKPAAVKTQAGVVQRLNVELGRMGE